MKFEFYNIGCIENVELELKPFTLIAGVNQTGKSFILKCIYGILNSHGFNISELDKVLEDILKKSNIKKEEVNKLLEESDLVGAIVLFLLGLGLSYKLIKRNREGLQNKLKWIFQQKNLGNIVNKFSNSNEGIIKIITKDEVYTIKIPKDKDEIKTDKDELILKAGWANFISSPILLDLEKGIATYREYYPNNYGIPDIYWDILRDIRNVGKAEKIELIDIYKKIENIIGGKFEYEMGKGFVYKRGDKEFHINLVAYGIKIFGIIQMLIERNLITKGSVLILEEPEVHLHPSLRFKLVDLLKDLANSGVYVVISTHSPEIVRYVEYLINTKKMDIKNCSFLHLKLNEKTLTSYGKSKGDYKELNEIMKSLTEDYFDIVVREELEMED
ncbi:ATP-binding protein [Methanotorris igneus]|uniref:ATPase AAA-type core domain-containing protein n=1 Tax=Methanotorris igneus (strain DSM 5666 / JCM 11834 / Kol 5) TaxID=880724 RepID=F6BCV9_METIK|nr:ATP-binding protein [Methanotorris igneus]AEF96320.1 hypothetical protein Metig_0774 [Methanotorris igneus Kol 5]